MNSNSVLCSLILIAMALGITRAVAQTTDPSAKIERNIKPDPEAGNLGKYGNYNLNLSEGQVAISVPLFSLAGANLEYAVALNYDHKGILVDERATSAGQNWTVSGMGVITRTVVGLPDEKLVNGYNANYTVFSGNNAPATPYSPSSFNDIFYRATLGQVDFQQDNFSFSFNGRSGKFFFNPADGQYYTIPFSKLSIQKVTLPGNDYYFLITDEQGYQYTFNQKTQSTFESSSSGDGFVSDTYDAQWYLTKVVSPDNITEFELEYIADAYINDVNTYSYTQRYLKAIQANASGPNCSSTTSPYLSLSGGSTTNTTIHHGSLLVSKIKSPFEDLRFVYGSRSDESLRLDSILLQRKDNSIKQAYKFYHGYYAVANKLRLDSIELFADGASINKHRFFYNAGNILPANSKGKDHWGYAYTNANVSSLFPRIWYTAQYIGDVDRSPTNVTLNGVLNKIVYPTGGSTEFEYELNDYGRIGTGNSTTNVSVPIINNTSATYIRRYTQNGGGSTNYTFTTAIAGVVHFSTKRDNCDGNPPNGGQNCTIEPCQTDITLNGPGLQPNVSLNGQSTIVQEFDFYLDPGTYTVTISNMELLDYGRVTVQYPVLQGYNYKPKAGGLRIKTIKKYDQFSGYQVRKFTYLDPADPSRSSGVVPREPEYTYMSNFGSDCTGSAAPDCNVQRLFVNLTSESNTSILFSNGSPVSYIRVVETVGENGEGGSIDHRFSFKNDVQDGIFPYNAPTSYSWRRGQPMQNSYYTASNNLVKEEFNEYTNSSFNFLDLQSAKFGFLVYCPHRAYRNQLVDAFTHQISEWTYLNKTTTKTYPDNGGAPLIEEVNYYYDNPNHIQLTRVQTSLSDGTTIWKRTKYAGDYSTTASSSDVMISTMNKMVQKNMISLPVEETETLIKSGQEYINTSTLTTYKEFAADKLYPWKSYTFRAPGTVTFTTLTSSNGTSFTQDTRYHFDEEFNAYSSAGKLSQLTDETGRSFSLLYGYGGLLPIAYLKNGTLSQLYYNGFEENAPGAVSTAKFGTYGFTGVLTIPGIALQAGSYLKSWWQFDGTNWSYQSQVINHNGVSNILVGTGGVIDEVSLRPQASILNTYSHEPGVGQKSKMLDNGLGTKYEYDNLSRLLFSKDHKSNILKKYSYQFMGGL